MPEAPRRVSIHDQLVGLIRTGILAGRWRDRMPAEGRLCRDFQVSRMTLRKALAQLANERWIELGGRGVRHRILRVPRAADSPVGKVVRLLTPFSSASMSSMLNEVVGSLDERLSSRGLRLEIERHPRVFSQFQTSRLERLDRLTDTAAWVLTYSTPEIQQWFSDRGTPTVVVGRAAESIPLPSIHPDGGAIARHAAGLFHSRGHREMAYLIAKVTSITDRVVADEFAAEAARLGARARIATYEMDPADIRRCVLDLLASRPRPTAFMVGASETSISLLCHLLSAGLRVPDQASITCASDDYHLGMTVPPISRYRINGRMVGRKVADTVVDLLEHGPGKERSFSITPEFVAGGSVAQAP